MASSQDGLNFPSLTSDASMVFSASGFAWKWSRGTTKSSSNSSNNLLVVNIIHESHESLIYDSY